MTSSLSIKTERSFAFTEGASCSFSRYEGVITGTSSDFTERVSLMVGSEPLFKAVLGYVREARYIGGADDQRLYAQRLERIVAAATESIRCLKRDHPEVFADKSEEVTAS